jgi:malto-oligosyltrehalose synthase
MHGYDVIDPTRVSADLGGEDGFVSLARAARSRRMGLLIDIVPNHMSTSEPNERWMDVLRFGQSPTYAHWFDIDWRARDGMAERGKILLPVLGDELDRVVHRGELTVELNDGAGFLRYFDRCFPLAPGSTSQLTATPDHAQLHALLDAQHYVLDYWRTAKAHVNYRRFFTIDELVGVRVEDRDVFEATHALFARLMREGLIAGVRVDHADGLSDPAEYFRRLRALLGSDAYIVAEKILSPGEQLSEDWPIEGTTGYDFMAAATDLLVDARQRTAWTSLYASTTGRSLSYAEIARDCRRAVLDGPLAGQFHAAAHQLFAALRPPVEYEAFHSALHELFAGLTVYRTYHSITTLDPHAARVIADARKQVPASSGVPSAVLDAVAAALVAPPEHARIPVMRLQQLMPAVQAKAVEDRAFYRYVPLLSLNDVGSDPAIFGRSVTDFHAHNKERARRWPHTMLATATHDHKRGEDVRARLDALSELPEDWGRFLDQCRASVEVSPPSSVDEYLLYQTLAAMWPDAGGSDGQPQLVQRLRAYAVKAAREAGERTNWDAPNEAYEALLAEFVEAAVPGTAGAIDAGAVTLPSRLDQPAISNALSQVLLRALSPGVTDTYQGTELWDFSLVDPDNRRPVDYQLRRALLGRVAPLLEDGHAGAASRRATVSKLIEHPEDGAIKLYVLARALRRRRALHPLCVTGEYVPLEVRGGQAEHAVAFARHLRDRWLIAVATRWPATLHDASAAVADWADAALLLPPEIPVQLQDALTDHHLAPMRTEDDGMLLPVSAILGTLPVALLEPA